jgi:hypothetical protein
MRLSIRHRCLLQIWVEDSRNGTVFQSAQAGTERVVGNPSLSYFFARWGIRSSSTNDPRLTVVERQWDSDLQSSQGRTKKLQFLLFRVCMIGFRYVRSVARAQLRNGNPIAAADAAEALRTKRRRVIIWLPLIFCGRVLRKRENIAVSDYKVDCFPRFGANPTGSPFDERPGLGARFRMQDSQAWGNRSRQRRSPERPRPSRSKQQPMWYAPFLV